MKYRTGDIMISFRNKVIYLLQDELLHYSDVLATEREANTFKTVFLDKGTAAANLGEFKKVFPEINTREYKTRVYGILEMDENLYLNLRTLKSSEPFNKPAYNFTDIVRLLVQKQLDNKLHKSESKARQKVAEIVDKMNDSLSELKKYI
jgi:hypothetical protein